MGSKLKVYMAGPDVFLPDVFEVAARKKQILEGFGFEGLFPLDNVLDPASHSKETFSRLIKEANCSMMQQADAIIANLTPFHGPSADVGTAYEVGYMDALHKPVFAYMNVQETFVDRVQKFFGGKLRQDGPELRDKFNMAVENFGLRDNLMLEWAVRSVPTRNWATAKTTRQERYSSVVAYEQAVRLMARELLGAPVTIDPAIVRIPAAL